MNDTRKYSITVIEHDKGDSFDVSATFTTSREKDERPSSYESFFKLAYLEFAHRLRLVEEDNRRVKEKAKEEAAQQESATPATTSVAPESPK
jgi:uncharacterized protein YdaU (DUF1376 family)